MKKLSWKAVKKGKIFCSPGCGRGCTWEEYQIAWEKGKALAERLGFSWTAVVHENLGWHYKAVSKCGRLEVWGRPLGFSASFLGGRWIGSGKTPEKAVLAAIRQAKDYSQWLLNRLEGL